jgi:hypothetical protein
MLPAADYTYLAQTSRFRASRLPLSASSIAISAIDLQGPRRENGNMTSRGKDATTHHMLTEDQLMELTNITIEMDALVRIFEHASCDKGPSPEGVRQVYSDMTSLLRPVCSRLERLRQSVMQH